MLRLQPVKLGPHFPTFRILSEVIAAFIDMRGSQMDKPFTSTTSPSTSHPVLRSGILGIHSSIAGFEDLGYLPAVFHRFREKTGIKISS
jgi:hypothetical protein